MSRSGDRIGITSQGTDQGDGVSHVTLDIGGFAIALGPEHPVRRDLIIATELAAAQNAAGSPGHGRGTPVVAPRLGIETVSRPQPQPMLPPI